MTPGRTGPEQIARQKIDAALVEAGWVVQNRDEMNLAAAQGVAVREFALAAGHGFADYLLFVDERPVGVLEAKAEGHPPSGVEIQAQRYTEGLPSNLDAPVRPLPFMYISSGSETVFANLLDPNPRSRPLFAFHRPATLAEWLEAEPLPQWAEPWAAADVRNRYGERPSTLRSRVRVMPKLEQAFLYPNQVRGITNLENSLRQDRPRALVQMATGSGKTLMAITSIYRLIKFGGARRVLFLVDRSNLGEQAEKEFQNFRTPDDQRKFTELYDVQRMGSNTVRSSAKVVITTIQRLYSMLRGEVELDETLEEGSQFDTTGRELREPPPVVYSASVPPEYFDVVFIDECHRSIYSLWRQVLEYFDAYLVGLTATPAKHTFGFFHQNLVMEYGHEQAVADGVNVDFEVYRIRTKITTEGAKIEANPEPVVGIRDRQTRLVRWKAPDEDIVYGAKDLDRNVVAKDQIRLIVKTFRDKLFSEIFPGRREVPKTLIFAKDDSHAEDIVHIVREEFAKGNEFAQKITYKTTGEKPANLIQDFRNSYNPRIAVTVDMVATGTDIRPIEIVMFMRQVKSRIFFEQMKGRGVRIISRDELKAVTPDADAKTHFVIVDCVGVCDGEQGHTQPLERKRSVTFKALLEHVAAGGTDPDYLSSLASRLARLDKQCGAKERERIREASEGASLQQVSSSVVAALDPDRQIEEARQRFDVPEGEEPSDEQVKQTAKELATEAVRTLATRPALRTLLVEVKKHFEQIIDEVSKDELLDAGHSEDAKVRAQALIQSFEQFLKENKDEIDALQFFYSQPYGKRLRFADIKALAEAIQAPPRSWTQERLWRAYDLLAKDKVRGASSKRLLTDIVSLVRYGLHQEQELVPYAEQVRERFNNWMAQQDNQGRRFTLEQVRWLEMMRDHISTSLEMDLDDFDLSPFAEEGGLGRATRVFGPELTAVVNDLNEELVA